MTYTDILFNINNDNNPEYIKMNQITKIDIIDWSYFTWYMIFSIRKGITSKKIKNGVTNYFKSVLKRKIVNKLRKIGVIDDSNKNNNKNTNIVILAMDCNKNKIWRKYFYPNYKITDNAQNSIERINHSVMKISKSKKTYIDNEFNVGEIIGLLKDIVIPHLEKRYNFKVIHVDDAEADDIIGVMANYLDTKYKNNYYYKMYFNTYSNMNYNIKKNIIIDDARIGVLRHSERERFIRIIGGDTDFYQLLSPNKNISLYNLEKKMLYTSNNIDSEYHKIHKILNGDISDNIDRCYISDDMTNLIIQSYLYFKNDQRRMCDFWNYIFYNNEDFKQHFLFNSRLILLDTDIKGLPVTKFNIPFQIKNKIINMYNKINYA